MSTLRVDTNTFWRDGFLLIKRVFSHSEIEAFRQQAYEAVKRDREAGRVLEDNGITHALGDLLSKDGLRSVILDERVRSAAKQLLDADPIYFGCSSLQIGGRPGPAHWHKDNRPSDWLDPNGLDWTAPRFPVVRMGIYLQDHARHSNGLSIRVGSHRAAGVRHGRPYIIPTEPGDLIVWPLTTTHAGLTMRLKFAGSRALRGRWMKLLPKRLVRPEERERVTLFMTFGRESDHLDRFIEMQKGRPDEMKWYRNSHFGPDVWRLAKESGLTIRSITPEYGTPDATQSGEHAVATA